MAFVKPATLDEAREFFKKELREAMSNQKLNAHDSAVEYLADLLVRNMSSESFYSKDEQGNLKENVLVDLYAQYLQGDEFTKRNSLRRLGDICLMITGFFSDSITRKLVDMDYYFGMGGGAYWQLSTITLGNTGTYQELSQKFRPFSDVLGEMSERSGIQNNSDLLRTYERWLFTGSDRLKQLLSTHGIETPFAVNPKTKH
ncbi:MAG: hypothetical protein R3B54_09240 [Bdellovibrionota bacterium]